MTEEWKPVVGYEGLYEVSTKGRVRSLDRHVAGANGSRRLIRGRMLALTPSDWNGGYISVELSREGRGNRKRVLVHRIELEAFIGPCPPGQEGCHKDDNEQNNDLANLYWGTRADNMRDAVRNGTHHWAKRDECSNGHKYTAENTAYRKGGARRCRACSRRRSSEWKRKKRVAA